MMTRIALLAALVLFGSLSIASAHGPKGSKPAGANGGEIADVEGGHIEMVATASELRLYVTDLKDAPLPSAGLNGRVIIQNGGKQFVLPLVPKEPNLLVAALAAPLTRDAKVAVSTTLVKDGKPVQARFVVK
jgi:hypothetical protein